MKKYNKPEIEALALEIVDVIATSVETAATESLTAMYSGTAINVAETGEQIQEMTAKYTW